MTPKEKLEMLESIGMKDEYDFLLWFYQRADFGPPDDDTAVRRTMMKQYCLETGKEIPEGYEEEE